MIEPYISKNAGLFNTEWERKAWADAFQTLSTRLRKKPPTRVAGREVVTVDMRTAPTTMGETIPMYDTRYARDLLARLASPGPHDVVQKR